MQAFTAKYSDKIQGVLSGFDRLIFRGSQRNIGYTAGLNSYPWANHVLLKDFGSHANEISDRIKEAALRWHADGRFNTCHPARTTKNKSRVYRTTGSQKARSAPSPAGAVSGI